MGDFNSRIASEQDHLDFDKYLDDDIFIQSVNSTTVTTRIKQRSSGRQLANVRLGEEENVGQFTFVSHSGLSVVVYLLCWNADSKGAVSIRQGSDCISSWSLLIFFLYSLRR